MTPAVRASRGTKRRCQNESCGLPFYDLNRQAIVCPNCSSAFVVVVVEPRPDYRGRSARPFVRPVAPMPVVAEVSDAAEELADEPLVEQAEGDTILEVDEEDEDDNLAVAVEQEPGVEE